MSYTFAQKQKSLQRKESFPKEANLIEVFFTFPAVEHESKKAQRTLSAIKAIRDDTTIPTSCRLGNLWGFAITYLTY